MTPIWARQGIACVVMAGLMAGCTRPTGPTGPSGVVHLGQTGRYLTFEADPGSAYQFLADRPPMLVLDDFTPPSKEIVVTGHLSRLITVRTPVVVTENAADEEFWEHILRASPGVPRDSWLAVDRPFFVLGGGSQCETIRDSHERSGIRTGPCIGPHYFKRTGPPVQVKSPG